MRKGCIDCLAYIEKQITLASVDANYESIVSACKIKSYKSLTTQHKHSFWIKNKEYHNKH